LLSLGSKLANSDLEGTVVEILSASRSCVSCFSMEGKSSSQEIASGLMEIVSYHNLERIYIVPLLEPSLFGSLKTVFTLSHVLLLELQGSSESPKKNAYPTATFGPSGKCCRWILN